MDSGACADQSNHDLSRKFSEKLDDVSNEEAVELSTMANEADFLEPITPVLKREAVDVPFDCDSPLSKAKRPAKVSCFALETIGKGDQVAAVDDGSPRTPKDVIFNPFAPGPDNMAMAPLCKKCVDQMRISVARRLNFDSSLKLLEDSTDVDDIESISDEEMFESVYNNLLEAIVLNQTEGLLAEISNIQWDSESCKTPPTPHLNGIAETCPGAPMKPSAKSRKLDLGLRRKLEF